MLVKPSLSANWQIVQVILSLSVHTLAFSTLVLVNAGLSVNCQIVQDSFSLSVHWQICVVVLVSLSVNWQIVQAPLCTYTGRYLL